MRFSKKLVGIVAVFALAMGVWAVRAARPIPLPPVMRLAPCDEGECLEVPVVTYGPRTWFGDTPAVDFIGAVHLGEKRYFEELNARFKTYQALLFELVADPKRLKELASAHQDSVLGVVQRKMSETLGLSFQLDIIDYQASNFVHADMTPQQLSQSMNARGESLPQMLLRMLKLSFDPEIQRSFERSGFDTKVIENINPIMLVFRGPTPDEQRRLRNFMAHGLTVSDQFLKMLEGDKGSSLIAGRNEAAMQVLHAELAAGKTKLGIFYGVGHLPDMHQRITKELGLEIKKVEWLKAWGY